MSPTSVRFARSFFAVGLVAGLALAWLGVLTGQWAWIAPLVVIEAVTLLMPSVPRWNPHAPTSWPSEGRYRLQLRTLSFGSLSVASLIAVLVAISQADPVFVIAFGVATLFVLVAIARVIRRACLDRALVTFETDQRGTIRMANGQALPFTITR